MSVTPIYALRKFDDGEPARNVGAIVNQHADSLEAALLARGVPPADLPALIAAGWFTDSGWQTLTLSGAWVGSSSPGYRKIGKLVVFRGEIWGGAAGTSPFTLPTGFRPTTRIYSTITGGAYTTTGILLDTTGVFTVQNTKAASPGFSLGDIRPFVPAGT